MIYNFILFRKKLTDEFKHQMTSFATQWEADLEKSKEQEDKLQVIKSFGNLNIKMIITK